MSSTPDHQDSTPGETLPLHVAKVVAGKLFKQSWAAADPEASLILHQAGFDLIPGGTLQPLTRKIASGLSCPSCGMTKADFESSGRFGCPRCYETFGRPLKTLLKKMHRGTQHLGKIPARHLEGTLVTERISLLQSRLTASINDENYEEAAVLRDDINQLKKLQASQDPIGPAAP